MDFSEFIPCNMVSGHQHVWENPYFHFHELRVNLLSNYIVSYLIRQQSEQSPLWEPQISHKILSLSTMLQQVTKMKLISSYEFYIQMWLSGSILITLSVLLWNATVVSINATVVSLVLRTWSITVVTTGEECAFPCVRSFIVFKIICSQSRTLTFVVLYSLYNNNFLVWW